MFYLNLNDMEFMAKHGVLAEEKVTPQKFVVDVRVETDQVLSAATTDCIDDALNYVGVYEIVHDIMMNRQFDLIETISVKIAREIVVKYDTVISVDVKVTKVNPPIEGYTGTVSCEYIEYGSE